MASSTDNGNQTITFDYNNPATGSSFNKLLYKILPAGLYGDMPTLTEATDTSVLVSTFQAILQDSASDMAIKVWTKDDATAIVSETENLVVARFIWAESTENYVEIIGIAEVDLSDDDIIIGLVNYSGSVIESFSYVNQTNSNPKDYADNTSAIALGTVWMFDANTPTLIDGITVEEGSAGAWTDNVTLPGWYACVDGNQAHGCPNLVDKFIMGKLEDGTNGATGGSNSHTITTAEMPAHTHTIDHDHTSVTSGTQSASHTHYTSDTTTTDSHNHNHGIGHGTSWSQSNLLKYSYTTLSAMTSSLSISSTDAVRFGYTSSDSHSHTVADTTDSQSASHTHSVDLPSFSGSSGSNGSGTAIDIRPSYYSLIYIRKCIA